MSRGGSSNNGEKGDAKETQLAINGDEPISGDPGDPEVDDDDETVVAKPVEPKAPAEPKKWKVNLIKFLKFFLSHVFLCSLVIFYAVMGGYLFRELESVHEIQQRYGVSAKRTGIVQELWKLTVTMEPLNERNWTQRADDFMRDFQDELVDFIKNKGWDGRDETIHELQWSFTGSCLYAITLITTIGYGHIAPKTTSGRFITMLYSMIGIPLTLLCLANLGNSFAALFRHIYKFFCLKKDADAPIAIQQPDGTIKYRTPVVRVPIFVCLIIIGGYIMGGAVLFSQWEKDWSYLVGAYFCFITLSTIGLGDFVFGVGNDLANTEKLVSCTLYLWVGLSIISMCFTLMQEEVKAKLRSLGKKLGIIKSKRLQQQQLLLAKERKEQEEEEVDRE